MQAGALTPLLGLLSSPNANLPMTLKTAVTEALARMSRASDARALIQQQTQPWGVASLLPLMRADAPPESQIAALRLFGVLMSANAAQPFNGQDYALREVAALVSSPAPGVAAVAANG